MSTLTETFVDLPTSRGDMRVHLFVPQAPGRHPGVIFYSEIFQVTSPIRRMAAALSGHGYVVAVPEVYHGREPHLPVKTRLVRCNLRRPLVCIDWQSNVGIVLPVGFRIEGSIRIRALEYHGETFASNASKSAVGIDEI